jgi:hypothetical protein
VFAVPANGSYYSDWVVGTAHARAVDQNWPAAGTTRLYHATGVWPLVMRDETVVEHTDPDRQLIRTLTATAPCGDEQIGSSDRSPAGCRGAAWRIRRIASDPSARIDGKYGDHRQRHRRALSDLLDRDHVEARAISAIHTTLDRSQIGEAPVAERDTGDIPSSDRDASG